MGQLWSLCLNKCDAYRGEEKTKQKMYLCIWTERGERRGWWSFTVSSVRMLECWIRLLSTTGTMCSKKTKQKTTTSPKYVWFSELRSCVDVKVAILDSPSQQVVTLPSLILFNFYLKKIFLKLFLSKNISNYFYHLIFAATGNLKPWQHCTADTTSAVQCCHSFKLPVAAKMRWGEGGGDFRLVMFPQASGFSDSLTLWASRKCSFCRPLVPQFGDIPLVEFMYPVWIFQFTYPVGQ